MVDRLASGDFDDDAPPARIHGDLWSGNVLWSPDGVVLIDPAAHGGHRITDLAMLALFGTPHLNRIHAAYEQECVHLPDGWRDLIGLHQLHPLLVHAELFGGRLRLDQGERRRSLNALRGASAGGERTSVTSAPGMTWCSRRCEPHPPAASRPPGIRQADWVRVVLGWTWTRSEVRPSGPRRARPAVMLAKLVRGTSVDHGGRRVTRSA